MPGRRPGMDHISYNNHKGRSRNTARRSITTKYTAEYGNKQS